MSARRPPPLTREGDICPRCGADAAWSPDHGHACTAPVSDCGWRSRWDTGAVTTLPPFLEDGAPRTFTTDESRQAVLDFLQNRVRRGWVPATDLAEFLRDIGHSNKHGMATLRGLRIRGLVEYRHHETRRNALGHPLGMYRLPLVAP